MPTPVTFKLSWPMVVLALLAGVCLFKAGAASSPQRPLATPATIALVDLERLMGGLQEVKERNTGLKSDFEKKKQTLSEMDARLTALKKEIETLPADSLERRNKVAQHMELDQQLQTSVKISQRLVDMDKGELVRGVYEKVRIAIAKVAQKDGFSLVLLDDRGLDLPKLGSDSEINNMILNKRILFADDTMDLTDRMITVMNDEYSAPAPRSPK